MVLGGDFNTVRFHAECIGCNRFHSHQKAIDFNDFIGLMEIEYLPTGPRNFSWSRGSGGVLSRIDRFLL